MSSDNQFTSLGPAIIGFQTDGTNIDTGAEISGNDLGVAGHCGTSAGFLGKGDVGVHGVGANNPDGDAFSPSTGILAEGGRQDDVRNTSRAPQGAGIVGVAGASPVSGQPPRQLPSFTGTGNVGVFGLGGDGETHGSTTGAGLSGPGSAGPGVLGQGGVSRNFLATPPVDDKNSDGVGVVGVSGSSTIPKHNAMHGVGVFGTGTQVGVSGTGTQVGVSGTGTQVGVQGIGSTKEGRGGIFTAAQSAQVQLLPRKTPTSTDIVDLEGTCHRRGQPDEPGPAVLPKDGQPGDLFATKPDASPASNASLWFCTRGEVDNTPALWCEVLLGLEFPGQATD